MSAKRLLVTLAILCGLLPASAAAVPAAQQPSPILTASPHVVSPGAAVHVTASGAGDEQSRTLCLGLLGPDRNLELGLSPAFRGRVGQMTIGPDGSGESDIQIPEALATGSYRLVLGGCPPQPDLAPLAALATASLIVAPGPPGVAWYFAEGSTQPPFDTWFLVQNPNASAATVRFAFQGESGPTTVRDYTVAPNARFSLFANEVVPNAAFSTRVESDQPVFVERSMFVDFDGTSVTGIAAPQGSWLFAEGATVDPFHTWLLIQNPNAVATSATIRYLLRDREPVLQTLTLPPASRTSVFVNEILPGEEFGIRVDADQPIIAERSIYRFPGNAAATTPGANAPGDSWFFAEGASSQPPSLPVDTFLLLQNPQDAPAEVTIDLFDVAGEQRTAQVPMAPTSRSTLYLNDLFPNADFGIRVTSDQPVVVERSLTVGVEPRGFAGSLGAQQLATEWNLPEGSTQPHFTTVIAIFNPNDEAMTARVELLLESGQVLGRDLNVGPARKVVVNARDFVPRAAFSVRVRTSLPSVVERTMYLAKDGSTGITNAIAIPR